jgi:low affinity Fe/Cu permease
MTSDQATAVQPARKPAGPSDTGELSFFDRFASAANHFVSRALFFSLCLLLVVIWLPSYFLFGSVDTWQLIINTITTIVTFLLVALLQNTQTRADAAIQQKLNAIADGRADLMDASSADNEDLRQDTRELRQAVGLEKRESA